jgi:kynurenine formamidase
MAVTLPTEADVLHYMETCSNWGRWGEQDEFGTLNLITPEKRLSAFHLVREGAAVTCARPVTTDMTADTTFQVMRFMVDSGEGRDPDSVEGARPRRIGASEFIGMVFHGATITHVDSLAHIFWQGKIYNGRPAHLVTSREGAQVESVDLLHNGVMTRGVLLDIARTKGKDWLELGEPVLPADLEAAEQACGVRVEPGDILLIRTGYVRRRHERGPVNPMQDGSPGPQAACLPWFHQRGIAMLGSDTHNDLSPSGYPNLPLPVHVVGIVAMGLWLIDNCNLEDLAQACATRQRWEFLLTIAPLRLCNVTGSPVNPLAIF